MSKTDIIGLMVSVWCVGGCLFIFHKAHLIDNAPTHKQVICLILAGPLAWVIALVGHLSDKINDWLEIADNPKNKGKS